MRTVVRNWRGVASKCDAAVQRKSRLILSALLLMLQFVNTVHAATPENGLYWAPTRPANLYVIEHQKGRMALVIYSYDAQGRPEWYSASGPLLPLFVGSEEVADQALFDAPLTRAVGGPPLGTQGRMPDDAIAYPSFVPVGRVVMTFYAEAGNFISVRIGDTELVDELLPFNFNFGGFGRHYHVPWQICWPDWTGEWVFVDRAEPTKAALRYHFQAPSVRVWDQFNNPLPQNSSCGTPYQTHWIEYPDEYSDAVLRCVRRGNAAGIPSPLPEGAFGCEIVEGAEVALSFFWSSSHAEQLKRIRAWSGPAAEVTFEQVVNDPTGPTITGYRVE